MKRKKAEGLVASLKAKVVWRKKARKSLLAYSKRSAGKPVARVPVSSSDEASGEKAMVVVKEEVTGEIKEAIAEPKVKIRILHCSMATNLVAVSKDPHEQGEN
jgi:hypothetical protein